MATTTFKPGDHVHVNSDTLPDNEIGLTPVWIVLAINGDYTFITQTGTPEISGVSVASTANLVAVTDADVINE